MEKTTKQETKKPQGFIMIGDIPMPHQQLGIVISKKQKNPSKCLQNLLTFNETAQDGIINIRFEKINHKFFAYGDHVRLNPQIN